MFNKLNTLFLENRSFLGSLLLGIIIWVIAFIFSPINTSPLGVETGMFLFTSILFLILGYFSFSFNFLIKKIESIELDKYFRIALIVIFSAFLLRYIDLFFLRELSFNFPFYKNKGLTGKNAEVAPFLLTIFSTLRALYFLPLLYLIVIKSKNKSFWTFSVLLILLDSLEIFLFGTRKPLFYLAIIVFLALISTYGTRKLFFKKNIILAILLVVFLGGFSFLILNKRVSENTQSTNALLKVTKSRYNDFVQIDDIKLKELYVNPTSFNTKLQVLLIHTGQYIVHGVYELDYIISKDLPRAKGVYSFNPVYKFLNRIGVVKDINLDTYHPRGYVYVTFFGSLFIDFGWFSIVVIFLFGVFQKLIYQMSKISSIAKIFWILLLSINLAIPVFNLAAGAGLYVIVFMCFLLFGIFKKQQQTNLKKA